MLVKSCGARVVSWFGSKIVRGNKMGLKIFLNFVKKTRARWLNTLCPMVLLYRVEREMASVVRGCILCLLVLNPVLRVSHYCIGHARLAGNVKIWWNQVELHVVSGGLGLRDFPFINWVLLTRMFDDDVFLNSEQGPASLLKAILSQTAYSLMCAGSESTQKMSHDRPRPMGVSLGDFRERLHKLQFLSQHIWCHGSAICCRKFTRRLVSLLYHFKPRQIDEIIKNENIGRCK